MNNPSRNNHYIPKGLLNGWADAEGWVSVYGMTVPGPAAPLWERKSIRSVGVWRDLYSVMGSNEPIDATEVRLANEVEGPAHIAIQALREAGRLTRHQWDAVTLYAALLSLRTPRAYQLWQSDFAAEWADPMLTVGLDGLVRLLSGERTVPSKVPAGYCGLKAGLDRNLKLKCHVEHLGDGQHAFHASAGMVGGRATWVGVMRDRLQIVAARVTRNWAVLSAPAGESWVLGSEPVVRRTTEMPVDCPFAAWLRATTEIFVPISDRLALWSHPDVWHGDERTTSLAHYLLLRRAALDASADFVVAREPVVGMSAMLPRRENLSEYQEVQRSKVAWHDVQSEAERSPPIVFTGLP